MHSLRLKRVRNMSAFTMGLFVAVLCSSGRAQNSLASPKAATPEALIQLVQQRFATGTQQEFNAVDPDVAGQRVIAAAIGRKSARQADLGKVVWSSPNRAVLLLTGTVVSKSSAAETVRSRHYSGFYEATHSAQGWSISHQLPFDAGNHIVSHSIQAVITPGRKIDVIDTVGIVAGSPYGFAVRLNDRAKIHQVKLNGKTASYLFGGGVFWIAAPRKPKAKLVLDYTVPEDELDFPKSGTPASGTTTAPEFGSYFNETFWAPLFDVDSANDTCPIAITVKIPAPYYLTTSVSQTETVKNGTRIVVGHTTEPEFILSLLYDRDWHPTFTKTGNFRFGTFLTSDYRWTPQVLEKLVSQVDVMLTRRFGPPQSNYLAVAEARELGAGSFRLRTNDLVVSAQGGGKTLFTPEDEAATNPQASLAHEVSHGWTMQATGPAANFLREGWATYCEWMFVGKQYGPAVEKGIWQTAYNYYFLGGHNGVRSILGNPDNGSIHYLKGAWIFHMLNEALGQDTFDRGMRAYIQIPRNQPAGYRQFVAAMSEAAGHDMTSFIMPWLAGKYIPNLETKIDGSTVVVTQKQPEVVFDLPLTMQITTASGKTVERPVHIASRTTAVQVFGVDTIRSVRIDPQHEYLLQRHLGEDVRLTLRAPTAKTVQLAGNFALKPLTAVKHDDQWTVDMPMMNGRYSWNWIIDGKKPETGAQYNGQPITGVQYVKPEAPMPTTAYPKQK